MKLSARNQLKGKVVKVKRGLVNAEVIVHLPGGEEIVSIVTIESIKALGLKSGVEVYAVIKASNVLLAVD